MTIAHQAAEALRRLHAMGVLHKHVVPGNILQSRSGVWQLADAHTSAMRECTLGTANMLTSTGDLDYAAPEQVLFGEEVTSRSDVWGLAACMLHALTGERPYGEASAQQIRTILSAGQGPAVPSSLLPIGLAQLLRACLQPAVDARPAAAQVEALLAELHSPQWCSEQAQDLARQDTRVPASLPATQMQQRENDCSRCAGAPSRLWPLLRSLLWALHWVLTACLAVTRQWLMTATFDEDLREQVRS